MSDDYFTIKSPCWVVDPFPNIRRMLKKHHKVKLVKPQRHKVVVSPMNRNDWDRFEEFCNLRADALNISYTDHGDAPRYHESVSSQVVFQKWNIPLEHIAHECSHAASDIVRHVRKVNPKLSSRNAEEVRSYAVGFLTSEVEKIMRMNRVRTK